MDVVVVVVVGGGGGLISLPVRFDVEVTPRRRVGLGL